MRISVAICNTARYIALIYHLDISPDLILFFKFIFELLNKFGVQYYSRV